MALKSIKIINDAVKEKPTPSFNFEKYAETIASIIATKENTTPFTIGISGNWGSGKTTLMREIEKKLKPEFTHNMGNLRNIKTVWFEAWKYKNEDEILAALISVIFTKLLDEKSFGDEGLCKFQLKSLPFLSKIPVEKFTTNISNFASIFWFHWL
jgi:iron(II)-dependent oxidoreductase